MTLTAAQLARFRRCGELYRLADVERVPLEPTTRMVVSRVVRQQIQDELRAKMDTGAILPVETTRTGLERLTRTFLSSDVALTALEASKGNRRVYEATLFEATRCLMVWRGVVAPKITPRELNLECNYTQDVHSVTAVVEILDGEAIRMTKVRSRRPEEQEGARDLSVAVQALALGQKLGRPPAGAIVDYLVTTAEFGYVRQEIDIDGAMLSAAQERIKIALQAIEEGSFSPVDGSAWWCQACQLRACCRYV